jgi:hypothetical protein
LARCRQRTDVGDLTEIGDESRVDAAQVVVGELQLAVLSNAVVVLMCPSSLCGTCRLTS